MIRSFRDKETRKVWEGTLSRRLPSAMQAVARRKLRMLHNAQTLEDLRVPPANRLEGPERQAQRPAQHTHQRPVADLFHLAGRPAHNVEIVDYH
jgi:proteic killer suppression protein